MPEGSRQRGGWFQELLQDAALNYQYGKVPYLHPVLSRQFRAPCDHACHAMHTAQVCDHAHRAPCASSAGPCPTARPSPSSSKFPHAPLDSTNMGSPQERHGWAWWQPKAGGLTDSLGARTRYYFTRQLSRDTVPTAAPGKHSPHGISNRRQLEGNLIRVAKRNLPAH